MSRTFERRRKPSSHLIHLIESTRNHHPNFLLFLGAGSSAESGVKTAREMIRDWREVYRTLYGNGEAQFIEQQPWYNASTEYSFLFESLYDQPSQRREYIENCIENGNPSWGYIYLVDLIRKSVFNTIFTTNFDDLLNEACYLYSSDVRPIVCAHDSSIRSVRITTKRPKIVKLHGDFLFDSIKNTVRELESLESNMRDKFKQYACEYGMIVLGYSGQDRSIMDTIDALLRNDDSFPHGVYWCVRKDAEVSKEVDHLCRFPKFHLVEIQGFNGFFADLYNTLSDRPHPFFSNPYQVASEKLANLLGRLRAPSGGIEVQQSLAKDVSILGNSLQQNPTTAGFELPHQVLAWNDFVQKDIEGAIRHIRNDLKRSVTFEGLKLAVQILNSNWSDELASDLVKSIEDKGVKKRINATHANSIAIELMQINRFELAERVLNAAQSLPPLMTGPAKEYILINQAQTYRHRGMEIPEGLKCSVANIANSSTDLLSRFGALVVLGQSADALELACTKSVDGCFSGVRIEAIQAWPIFQLLDPRDREYLKGNPWETAQATSRTPRTHSQDPGGVGPPTEVLLN